MGDLGELELLERIGARLDPAPPNELWSGDDAALVAWHYRSLLVATDMIVEGVDFDLSYASGADVGWKAIAVNCSDMAAMGAWPAHAVVALAMPDSTPLATFDGILEGLVAAARTWSLALVGGDLSEGPAVVLSVTLTAEPGRRGIVTRAGAQPGDVLCVTGTLGGAAGGLRVLSEGRSRVGRRGRLAERHLRPKARVREGVAIAESGARAMIDVSDGLALDLRRLVTRSGVGCFVEPTSIPVDPDLSVLEVDRLELALLGGDDYELLFAVPPRAAARVAERAGIAVTQIGTVLEEGAFIGADPLDEWTERAWQHLRR